MNNHILKSIIISLSGLLLSSACNELKELEETQVGFIKTFGGSDNDWSRSVQQTTDRGYIITGSTKSFGIDDYYDVWLIKTDSIGNEGWNKTYGGSHLDWGYSVQQTTDGGYIITGETGSYGSGYYDAWLIKTDSYGNEEWNQTFGGSGYDVGRSVQQTTDGGYVITGRTASFGNDAMEVWLIKTDSHGNEEWNQNLGYSDTLDWGSSVQQTVDGGYIITGSTYVSGNYNILLIKTDSNGNEQWEQTFDNGIQDIGRSVQETIDGGYIITGSSISPGVYGSDVWLIKTDPQGDEEWNHIFGGSANDVGSSVQQTNDGGYIITGWTSSFGNGDSDIWLIKTGSQGNIEWDKTFGGSSDESGIFIQQTTDGGYIITGSTVSYENGSSNVLLIKTDSEGNTVDYP